MFNSALQFSGREHTIRMKSFIGGILSLLTVVNVHACDICGGASSSFTVGMMPNSQHHYLGLRSSIRWFESTPAPDDHGYQGISYQQFTSTELYGRWRINQRFQLVGFMPYVFNTKSEDVKTNVSGLGDAVFFGNFVFIDNSDSLDSKIKQVGTIGLGIKVPTGVYFKLGFDEVNMLPGTGSWDGLINLNYVIQYQDFGLQNEASFTQKTSNKYAFRFGNALSNTGLLFYRWSINRNVTLIPQAGVSFTYNWKDEKNGQITDDTFNGGSMLTAQLNLNLWVKRFGISLQGNLPVDQQLNEGYVTQKGMLRVGVNYLIKGRK